MSSPNDPIEIVKYNPAWPALYEAEAERLRTRLSAFVMRLDHIGSTAIPDVAAKPVIDILLTLRPDISISQLKRAVESLAYTEMPPGPQTDACFFVKRDDSGLRTHHLHFIESNAAGDNRMLLRDFLCAHKSYARRYAALKRELAARFRLDRDAYIEGKTKFVEALLEKARAWRRSSVV